MIIIKLTRYPFYKKKKIVQRLEEEESTRHKWVKTGLVTQSNRVYGFHDFMCSLFSKAILFDFYLIVFVVFQLVQCDIIRSSRSISELTQLNNHIPEACRNLPLHQISFRSGK